MDNEGNVYHDAMYWREALEPREHAVELVADNKVA